MGCNRFFIPILCNFGHFRVGFVTATGSKA